MRLIKGIYIQVPNGPWIYVDIEEWGRANGPKTYVIQHNNRRITPYEQRRGGWFISLNSYYQRMYSGPCMAEMNKMQYGEFKRLHY